RGIRRNELINQRRDLLGRGRLVFFTAVRQQSVNKYDAGGKTTHSHHGKYSLSLSFDPVSGWLEERSVPQHLPPDKRKPVLKDDRNCERTLLHSEDGYNADMAFAPAGVACAPIFVGVAPMADAFPQTTELQGCLDRMRAGDRAARDELFRRVCG